MLNRAANFPAAQAALAAVVKRIRSYAGRDAVMRALIAELERDSVDLSVPIPAAAAKQMHFRAYASSKTRNLDGSALRKSK